MNDQAVNLNDRPIVRIGWNDAPEMVFFEVGRHGVTKIESVEQYLGEDVSICWFQIWKGDKVVARFNAKYVDTIHYDEVFYEQ